MDLAWEACMENDPGFPCSSSTGNWTGPPTARPPSPTPSASRWPALYTAVPGPEKLMFCLAGSGHTLVGSSGSYFREPDGELIPLP